MAYRFVTRAALAAAMIAAAGAAYAADAVMPLPPVAPAPAPVFVWDGAYVGVYGGNMFQPAGFPQVGVTLGYNFTPGDNLLVAMDLQLGIQFDSGIWFESQFGARLGVLLGAEDRVLLYSEGAIGYIAGFGTSWSAGGGVALGIGDSTSIYVETKARAPFGFTPVVQVEAGVNFHFGP